MAPLGQQTTEFQENALGPIHKTHQTNALKRAGCVGGGNSKVGRFSGLTSVGSPAAIAQITQRRRYKAALKLRVNTLSALTDAVAKLEARILLLEQN